MPLTYHTHRCAFDYIQARPQVEPDREVKGRGALCRTRRRHVDVEQRLRIVFARPNDLPPSLIRMKNLVTGPHGLDGSFGVRSACATGVAAAASSRLEARGLQPGSTTIHKAVAITVLALIDERCLSASTPAS